MSPPQPRPRIGLLIALVGIACALGGWAIGAFAGRAHGPDLLAEAWGPLADPAAETPIVINHPITLNEASAVATLAGTRARLGGTMRVVSDHLPSRSSYFQMVEVSSLAELLKTVHLERPEGQYGIVTVQSGADASGRFYRTAAFTGTSFPALQAAAEFFCSEDHMRDLNRRLGGTFPPNYQVVVRATSDGARLTSYAYQAHMVR